MAALKNRSLLSTHQVISCACYESCRLPAVDMSHKHIRSMFEHANSPCFLHSKAIHACISVVPACHHSLPLLLRKLACMKAAYNDTNSPGYSGVAAPFGGTTSVPTHGTVTKLHVLLVPLLRRRSCPLNKHSFGVTAVAPARHGTVSKLC